MNKKDLIRVSTDIPFNIWADLHKRAKREKMTIRPYLARLLEKFVAYQEQEEANERDEVVAEIPEGVAKTAPEELY
jgi:macrodomain Ter protein organizer (MatP/YcbG family)|tara:strand:- start:1727 stop:1954 length:228 start_codon:yes stop_codon:yes gene_type:complete